MQWRSIEGPGLELLFGNADFILRETADQYFFVGVYAQFLYLRKLLEVHHFFQCREPQFYFLHLIGFM